MSSFALSPRSDPFLPAASLASSAVATSEASSSASAAGTRSVRQAAPNPALSHCSCTTDSAYSSLYGPGQAAIHHQTIQRRRSIRSNADQASADLMLLPHCRTTSSFRAAYDLSPAMSETPELSGAAVAPSATAATSCTGAASMCSNANADKSSSSRTSELDGRIEQQRQQLLMDSDNENENEDEHFNVFDSTERLSATSTLYSTVRRARISRAQEFYSQSHSRACAPTLVIQNQARGSPYAFTDKARCRSRHHCNCYGNSLQPLPPPPPPQETVQPEPMFELMQQQQGAPVLQNHIDEDDDNFGGWPFHPQMRMHSLQREYRGQSFPRRLPPGQQCWEWEPMSQGQANHLTGLGASMPNELAAATASTIRLERRRQDDACVRQNRRRRPERSSNGTGGRRKGCCCPLLLMSLCLCAVSLALLTVGGVFLGLHLRSQAHSAFLAAGPTESDAAATPALVEAAGSFSRVPPTMPATAVSTTAPSPTLNPVETELSEILRQLDRRLIGLVNNHTHPCKDFYSYACGHFDRYASETLHWPMALTSRQQQYNHPTNIIELTSALIAQTVRRRLNGDFDGLGAVQAEQLLSTEGQQLTGAFRRCQIRLEVGVENSDDLCVASLQVAAPESVKSLLRYRSFNATGVHVVLVKLFNSARDELTRRVQDAQKISPHTRQSMANRLDRIHPMIDSSGNADLSVLRHEFQSSRHLNRRLEQLYLQMSDQADKPCQPEPCKALRESFSACVCLTNSSDLWLPFSSINPPLFHLAYPEELMYSYLGASVAEVLYWSISPKHRKDLFSSASEHLLTKSFECFAKQLPGDKPNTKLIETLVAKHVSLSVSLVLFRRSLGVDSFLSGGPEVDKRLRLFFLNWAQTQCSTDASQSADSRLLLNAALQRQTEFARVFQCPQGSRHHWTAAPVPCHYP